MFVNLAAAASPVASNMRQALFFNKKKKRFEISDATLRWQISKDLSADQFAIAYKTEKPPFRSYLKITGERYISLNSLEKRLDLSPEEVKKLKKIKDPQKLENEIRHLAASKKLGEKNESFTALDQVLEETKIIQKVRLQGQKAFAISDNKKEQSCDSVFQALVQKALSSKIDQKGLRALLLFMPKEEIESAFLAAGLPAPFPQGAQEEAWLEAPYIENWIKEGHSKALLIDLYLAQGKINLGNYKEERFNPLFAGLEPYQILLNLDPERTNLALDEWINQALKSNSEETVIRALFLLGKLSIHNCRDETFKPLFRGFDPRVIVRWATPFYTKVQ